MSRDIVDLTLSSDSDDEPARKRSRIQPGGGMLAPSRSNIDDDVVIVEPVRERPRPGPGPSREERDLGDEDLVIVGATGQVATRDLAHPRPDCAVERFTSGVCTSNSRHCSKCFCFVCDVQASACRYWGTGARERDHANARPLGYWRRLREAVRGGNTSAVHAEYNKSGPIGNFVQLNPLPPPQPPQQQPPPQRRHQQSKAWNKGVRTTQPGASSAVVAAAPAAPLSPEDASMAVKEEHVAPWYGVPPVPTVSVRKEPSVSTGLSALPPLTGCKGIPLPNPAYDPSAIELGTLRFRVKAVRGLTIDTLARRLQRFGYYCGTEEYGGMFTLGKIFESNFENCNGVYKNRALYLEMQPLPPPEEESTPVPTERIREVLVVDCLGRMPATVMGVRVQQECRRADLLEALAPELRPAFSAASELLHLVRFFGTDDARVVQPDEVLDDKYFSSFKSGGGGGGDAAESSSSGGGGGGGRAGAVPYMVLYRTAHHPAPTWAASSLQPLQPPVPLPYSELEKGKEESTAPLSQWATELPIYYHYSGGGGGGSSMPAFSSRATVPAWVLVHVRYLRSTPPDPSADSFDIVHAPLGSIMDPLTTPLLLPLRKKHTNGGLHAVQDVYAALMMALEPYRKRENPPVKSVMLMRGFLRTVGQRPQLPDDQFEVKSFSLRASHLSRWALQQLTAFMALGVPEACYRVRELTSPVVDPSSSPEALRESEAHAAEAERRVQSERKRKELSTACISELVRESRRVHPEDHHAAAAAADMPNGGRSTVATDVVLVPASRTQRRGAGLRDGELVITVYAWTRPGPGRASIFERWDEWSSIDKRQDPQFPLSATMELIATGVAANPRNLAAGPAAVATAPEATATATAAVAAGGGNCDPSESISDVVGHSADLSTGVAVAEDQLQRQLQLQERLKSERRRAREMMDSLRELRNQTWPHPPRSINWLLGFMQSGDRPGMEQPPGLTITMRPYQRQSLAFMWEVERLVDRHPEAATSTSSSPSLESSPLSGVVGVGLGPGLGAAQRSDPADEPDGGCPGGYRRMFWLPITNAKGKRYWYSPVFTRLALSVPAQATGGFLAEEMGLGKTVEVMALTLANPAAPSVVAGAKLPCGRLASRATLVVCAVSLVGQWQTEAQSKTNGCCRIYPYHGCNRIRDPLRLATEFDVVVTTYQTLASDHSYAGSVKDPCQQIKWHRVVFDEGHTLRSEGAKLWKAAVELAADRRWICTGTPINNAVDDLLGQFGAIHMVPLAKKVYFSSYIKQPFHTGLSRPGFGLSTLSYVLRRTMIRHTKAQNLAGEDVLQLPPKTETDVPVYLTAQEQDLYRRVHKEAQQGWMKLKAFGFAYVNSHLFTATSMLLPLRRICSGGLLRHQDLRVPDPERLQSAAGAAGGITFGEVGGASDPTATADADATATGAASAAIPGATAATADTAAVAGSGISNGNGSGGAELVPIPEESMFECPICVDAMDQPVVTRCNHWFCKECIVGWINASAHQTCPACRQPITASSLRSGVGVVAVQPPLPQVVGGFGEVTNEAAVTETTAAMGEGHEWDGLIGGDGGCGVPCESKLRMLLAELRAMREADSTAKALVLTQFSQSLRWLESKLIAEGFGHRTITGSMTSKKRTEAINSFQTDPHTCVFLLSMRAGAVGINLTAANHVFLLEPCMNPAMEEQAIGRSWRMGQQRPIVVKRFYIKGSVEERIMQVVKMRREGPGDAAGSSGGSASPSSPRPNPSSPLFAAGDYLGFGAGTGSGAGARVGLLREDRMDLRIYELDLMFRDPDFPAVGRGLDGVAAAGP